MNQPLFAEMMRLIAFGDDDAANLKSLEPIVTAAIPRIVNEFYRILEDHPGTHAILNRDDVNVSKLRETLAEWISQLFEGTYDEAYFRRRARIGHAHIRVALPQHVMITGIEILWQQFAQLIQDADPPDGLAKRRSLHKLLTLELSAMLETYKSRYAEIVQEKEHSMMEEKLHRAERLAEIGQLAASLAHEIKNPLAGISGAIQVIRDGMDNDHQHREIIGEILSQINRLDAVVKDLLIYARPVPPELSYCSLNSIVRRILNFMREESDAKRASLEFTTNREDLKIQADRTKIEQLLLNLLINAVQASPEGGIIKVSTEQTDGCVRLCVEDHGQGMSEDARVRAFEPFFTTKAKGTGLGLPICKTIVDTHGGRIAIESAAQKGARVTVEFPRVQR